MVLFCSYAISVSVFQFFFQCCHVDFHGLPVQAECQEIVQLIVQVGSISAAHELLLYSKGTLMSPINIGLY